MWEQTEDFTKLEEGLINRGFQGTNLIDNWGRCHKNERHYILRTDGLIIYTTYPSDWKGANPPKDYFDETWTMEEFTFEKLDKAMATVEQLLSK